MSLGIWKSSTCILPSRNEMIEIRNFTCFCFHFRYSAIFVTFYLEALTPEVQVNSFQCCLLYSFNHGSNYRNIIHSRHILYNTYFIGIDFINFPIPTLNLAWNFTSKIKFWKCFSSQSMAVCPCQTEKSENGRISLMENN